MNVDILIGQNFTELDDVTYFKEGASLHFKGHSSGLVLDKTNVKIGIEDPVAERLLLKLLNQFNYSFAVNSFEVLVKKRCV